VEDRPLQEAEHVARAKRGEVGAYEEIVRMHGTIAFRTAWVITGSAGDAEEAAQDAFVKTQRALGRFRDGSLFRRWLLTIAANEARPFAGDALLLLVDRRSMLTVGLR
jgi:DNA-directed RNA polymerase specialized sigma24 family protein